MVCDTFTRSDSVICSLDPRGRVVVGVAFAAVLALSSSFPVLCAGLGAGLVFAGLARLPIRPMLKRFAAVNLFVGFLALFLPFTAGGETLFRVGPLAFGRPGALKAAEVLLKANAIVLIITALLSTVELPQLGRALQALGAPRKLAQLFFFTVRYIDLLHNEYERLRNAMRVRCFRPGLSLHTYRTYGYLIGMLLVNSFDRSERVMNAMKCRGFEGEFHSLQRFCFRRRDAIFASTCTLLLVILVALNLI
ncbi:MAG: cobalt ECF transporter T component CbiQ [Planctomycetota bacterium]